MGNLSRHQTRPIHQLVGFVTVNLHAMFFRPLAWLRVILHYYKNLHFAYTDLLLACFYLFKNPHRIGRAFSKTNLYGETPLLTLDKIAKQCRILSKDCVYELGCGTGRTCFWLSHFVKCRAVGIEHVPLYVERAKRVKGLSHTERVEFRCEDFFETELSEASVIYLYGTAMEEDLIRRLVERFAQLESGVRIITTSYSLAEYDIQGGGRFEVEKVFQGWFPWGRADVFLNRRR